MIMMIMVYHVDFGDDGKGLHWPCEGNEGEVNDEVKKAKYAFSHLTTSSQLLE